MMYILIKAKLIKVIKRALQLKDHHQRYLHSNLLLTSIPFINYTLYTKVNFYQHENMIPYNIFMYSKLIKIDQVCIKRTIKKIQVTTLL